MSYVSEYGLDTLRSALSKPELLLQEIKLIRALMDQEAGKPLEDAISEAIASTVGRFSPLTSLSGNLLAAQRLANVFIDSVSTQSANRVTDIKAALNKLALSGNFNAFKVAAEANLLDLSSIVSIDPTQPAHQTTVRQHEEAPLPSAREAARARLRTIQVNGKPLLKPAAT